MLLGLPVVEGDPFLFIHFRFFISNSFLGSLFQWPSSRCEHPYLLSLDTTSTVWGLWGPCTTNFRIHGKCWSEIFEFVITPYIYARHSSAFANQNWIHLEYPAKIQFLEGTLFYSSGMSCQFRDLTSNNLKVRLFYLFKTLRSWMSMEKIW
jgi:hypothetical protein